MLFGCISRGCRSIKCFYAQSKSVLLKHFKSNITGESQEKLRFTPPTRCRGRCGKMEAGGREQVEVLWKAGEVWKRLEMWGNGKHTAQTGPYFGKVKAGVRPWNKLKRVGIEMCVNRYEMGGHTRRRGKMRKTFSEYLSVCTLVGRCNQLRVEWFALVSISDSLAFSFFSYQTKFQWYYGKTNI